MKECTPKTKLVRLTERAITEHAASHYKTLRDSETALYFRYTNDRSCGTYFVVKRPGANAPAKWYRLGNRKQLNANEARKAAKRKLVRLAEERPVIANDVRAIRTLHELLRWYSARREQETGVSKHTRAATISNIGRALVFLPDIRYENVTKAYIDTHLYLPMMRDYKLSTFQATLKTIKAGYVQAMALELIDHNPLAKTHFADFSTRRPSPRQTRLDDAAIKSFIKQLGKAPLKTRMLGAWLLLHASRIGETSVANIERIQDGRWEIREDEAKNQLNVIPITGYAQDLLNRYRSIMRKRTGYRGQYLFAQKRNRRKPVSATQASNMIRNATKGKVSPHDIRKRARTWWIDHGVDYFVGELLIGHKMKDLDAAYIQTHARGECLKALNQWHEYLFKLGLGDLIR